MKKFSAFMNYKHLINKYSLLHMTYLYNHQHDFEISQYTNITTENNHTQIFRPEYFYNK